MAFSMPAGSALAAVVRADVSSTGGVHDASNGAAWKSSKTGLQTKNTWIGRKICSLELSVWRIAGQTSGLGILTEWRCGNQQRESSLVEFLSSAFIFTEPAR